ncbi:RsmB/NOP family class I SAM-dependent RNA methyltransferase [Aestuariimicrobium kwangyangense]|uniref:RsmB/NOP family class I SAM-dependent RNA methyltransferase n=1 Tax=Aestuariimicrobium kwangyangense TaxID=396389 RepID=UPI000420EDE0|nr:transcription antitermination factor NusB [Aestuariimicrobium kwangyangense]
MSDVLWLATQVMTRVTRDQAYANLALDEVLRQHPDHRRSVAEVTELVYGTCRLMGTHDRVIEAASRRRLTDLQPQVVDLLRLTSHRMLAMRTPNHVAAQQAVDQARTRIHPKVAGLVNAVSRRISERSLDEWVQTLSNGLDSIDALALRTHHPRWIAESYRDLLGDEAEAALLANNLPAQPVLVVRPGLMRLDDLPGDDITPTRWSPFGFTSRQRPADIAAVRDGRAGVQDEGSQLVATALATAVDATGPWLDLCAGPGGKAALLVGLARRRHTWLLANEVAPHRADLVAQGTRAYPDGVQVICADGRAPAWLPDEFAAVMADVPCSGLGALRRRPDARWRKDTADVAGLTGLQLDLAHMGADSLAGGGVMAYVTCSPDRRETTDVIDALLAERDDLDLLDAPAVLQAVAGGATSGEALPDVSVPGHPLVAQLWPHRHGTDAMFLALLRRRSA